MTKSRPQTTSDRATDATTDREAVPSGVRGERRQGRFRTWTKAALRDVGYCGAVLARSIAGFTILVTGAAVTASLLLLVVGVFVWIGFVYVLRWTTWGDRKLAGWQRRECVLGAYRRPTDPGFISHLRTLSSDPQTWKDLAWLAVTFGFRTIDTLSEAAIAAAIGVALIPLVLVLARWFAATHAGLAVRMLARDATP